MNGRLIFDLAPARGDRFFREFRGTFPGDLDRMPSGHTRHCEARRRWGDGECECSAGRAEAAEAACPPSRIPDAPWRSR